MAAINKITVSSASGRILDITQWQKNIKTFSKELKDLPKRTFAKLPQTIKPTITNKARNYFKINYKNQEGWQNSSLSNSYRKKKAEQYNAGTMWAMGTLPGIVPMIVKGTPYGIRTGTTLDFISKSKGTDVKIRLSQHNQASDTKLWSAGFFIKLNSELFDGGNIRYERSKSVKEKTNNSLLAFSNLITPKGSPTILTTLTYKQLTDIRNYVEEKWTVRLGAIISAEVSRL